MFYCNDCGKKRGWPCAPKGGGFTIPPSSWGRCEICYKEGHTNDVPSKSLPFPEAKYKKGKDYELVVQRYYNCKLCATDEFENEDDLIDHLKEIHPNHENYLK
jgi:hypothetical protein